jgi:CRP-like cAMP-binding protein
VEESKSMSRTDSERHGDQPGTNVIPFQQTISPRSRRFRSKTDPARGPGTWVISDEARMALEKCELLRDLDRHQLMAVAALVEEVSFDANEMLIQESRPARYVYVITEGHCVAQVEMEHGWLSLGTIGPGDAAGWSSLIADKIYPASVRSLTHMRCARIESDGLRLLLNLEPEIGYPVVKRLSAIFCAQYEAALRALKTTG